MIFVIGDRRANENPHLAMAHVVFTKFHNQVAEQLGQINPHWDNNHLFEVGALFMILCMLSHTTKTKQFEVYLCKLLKAQIFSSAKVIII